MYLSRDGLYLHPYVIMWNIADAVLYLLLFESVINYEVGTVHGAH